ncbi:MAG: hypothetical protein VB878_19170 [Pirellulaceae bacterium]
MAKHRTLCLAVLCSLFGLANDVPVSAQSDDAGESRWYKGNMHTHSLWSDGNDFPEMICDWYLQNGYHFLTLSDHNVLSTNANKWISPDLAAKRGAIGALERYQERFGTFWVERKKQPNGEVVRLKTLEEFRGLFEKPEEFLLIQAEEITDHVGPTPVHINATNIAELIRPMGGTTVREAIRNNLQAVLRQEEQLDRPIFAHLNHPNFGFAVTAEDMAAVVEEQFFEVFNGHPSVRQRGDNQHVSIERMWDIANTIRIAQMDKPPLFGVATDDAHRYFGTQGSSPGRGWVMVRAGKLKTETLIKALRAGDFYSSSGVTLNTVDFEGKKLSLVIDGEEGVTYTTYFIGTRRGYEAKRQPVLDANGDELPVTGRYSDTVGQILASVNGLKPSYVFKGDELYVRARIDATKPHDNPAWEDQKKQAWTQPVGWRKK